MKKVHLLIITVLFIVMSIPLYAEEGGSSVNPYSYRRDFRKMDRYEISQKQTELRNVLNWTLPNVDPGIMKKIVDDQGNVTVYIRGQKRYSVSKSGDITYYTNGMKTRTDKILSNGKKYTYRLYTQDGNKVTTRNEFGDVLSHERIGEGDRVLEIYDSHDNLLYENDYDRQGHWMHDLVNNIWTRFDRGMQKEERRGAKEGPVIAEYFRGEKFGENGFWRHDLLTNTYARYDSLHTDEQMEVYGFDGTLMARNTWEKHRLKLAETFVDSEGKRTHTFREYGDFGLTREGLFFHDDINDTIEKMTEIVHAWRGSLHLYSDNVNTLARTHYDVEGKPDYITLLAEDEDGSLVDTGELRTDFVYLWEISDMSYEKFAEFIKSEVPENRWEDLNLDEALPALFEEIKKNEYSGKAQASMAVVFDMVNLNISLYNINNHSYLTVYVGSEPSENIFAQSFADSGYYDNIADLDGNGDVSYKEAIIFEEQILKEFYFELVRDEVDIADLLGEDFTYTAIYTVTEGDGEDAREVEKTVDITVSLAGDYDTEDTLIGVYIDMEKVGEGSKPYHMKYLTQEVIEQIDAGLRISWAEILQEKPDPTET